ncbi:MAG: hypothetical protein ACPL7C_14115, partial [Anaerolineae bacterium]
YGPPVPPPTIPAAPPVYGPPSPTVPGMPMEPAVAAPEEIAQPAPRWLWLALPIALVLCLAAAAGLGYWAYRQGKLSFLQPRPTPTAEPTATPPGVSEATPTPAPTVAPAQVALYPSATELKVGDLLTLTVTLTNTGDLPWTQTEYRLLGEWEPVLKIESSPEPSSEGLAAGGSRSVTFTLTAQQPGTATLEVLALIQTGGDRPRRDKVVSEAVKVNVQQP